ncbi:uncharacterized protein [Blastocystis hominis]|uniref:Ubiquitinyl hydrolase variant UBP zinc finger domain-containing protein n=1 Tax=Blastocystis hominis TaxID=12968 RepID=D8M1M1_BLAHO|nr:uncharacterized protein [Blastocystis hominis]CBK21960.2 unnamed protein product [Blastocystis hominis]|eukprot:XP_012896008.1 uncharacterized protein [Blastocystis hominis]
MDIAVAYLQCCDWNIEGAVSLFFDNGGAPLVNEPIIGTDDNNLSGLVNTPANCNHFAEGIKPLTSSTLVYKEECVYCFSKWDQNKGIDVCLTCYQGFCTGSAEHSRFHFKKSGHPLYLRLFRHELPSPAPASTSAENADSCPEKLTKLAIGVEGGALPPSPIYETDMQVVCLACDLTMPAPDFVVFDPVCDTQVREIGERILLSASGEKEKELSQWEAENAKPCPHCEAYQRPDPCPHVDLSENRWER